MAVTTSSGNGFALYNGWKLPVLPEWNETIYTYAVLQVYSGRYQFVVSSLPIYVTVSEGREYFSAPYDADGKDWVLYEDTGVWTESQLPGPGVWVTAPVFWANHDILYEDGTLYLDASDSISLDGMTVVEWDGDTSGLPTLSALGEFDLYIADSTFFDLSEEDPYYLRFTVDDGSSSAHTVYGNIGQSIDLDYTRQSIADGVYWSRYIDGALRCILSGDVPSYNLTGTAFFSSTVDGLGHAYTSLFAYRPAPTYDRTAFLSGLAMGLCGKGNPTFEGSGKMLYNGVALPPLPKRVMEAYPCAAISTDASYLVAFSQPITISDPYPVYVYPPGTKMIEYYMYRGAWTGGTESSFPDGHEMWGRAYYEWANFDIINTTDGSIYLAASDPVPVEDTFSKGYHVGAELRRKRVLPVAYLYNGVRLPNINSVYTSELQKDYPYAFIKIQSNGRILLCVFGAEAHYFEYTRPSSEVRLLFGSPPSWDDGFVDDGIKVPMQQYECAEYNNYQWTLAYQSSDGYVDITPPTSTPHWSNFNVEYNGSVYLEASEPIPVYK